MSEIKLMNSANCSSDQRMTLLCGITYVSYKIGYDTFLIGIQFVSLVIKTAYEQIT